MNLGAAAAQALGLALHELATNACKYGALSAAEGQVTIEWDVSGPPNRFRISWVERGGPPVVAPARSAGFGSKLVDRAV